jgi:hypothetical protein
MTLSAKPLTNSAILMLLALAGFTTCLAEEKKADSKEVAFEVIPEGTYRNFVGNWDEQKQSLLYALVRTAEEYGAVFHPAPVMGPRKPFAPEAALFGEKQILVLSRVVTDRKTDAVFAIEKISLSGKNLEVRFKFQGTSPDPNDQNTMRLKAAAQVTIPKGDYERVTFIENGKEAGVLKLTEGVWCVPAPKKE